MQNPVTITITDETAGGNVLNEIYVSLTHEVATAREIITARVQKEVEEFNNRKPGYFKGLVQPGDAEVTLNGYKLLKAKTIDPEKQVYVALESFLKNGYFLLVNNKQATSLDEEFVLSPKTVVSFVKLTQLVGG